MPPWWELHSQVDLSMVCQPRLSEVPVFNPQRDVLFGPGLADGLAQRLLATYEADARLREIVTELSMDFSAPDVLENPERLNGEDLDAAKNLREVRNALYERKIVIHRDWLMTNREDLGGRMPRQCLHGVRHSCGGDHHRRSAACGCASIKSTNVFIALGRATVSGLSSMT